MLSKRVAVAVVLSAAIVALPITEASARHHHGWFPLFWPFAAAAAVVGTAATIATAPIAAVTAPAYYPAYPYYGSPYAAPSYGYGYPAPPAYGGTPRHLLMATLRRPAITARAEWGLRRL
jgi:hypothetical protein